MEIAKNEIKKATIKKDRLCVVFNERFAEANITNVINKNCDSIIHHDLREAFNRLKLHLVVVSEQLEGVSINQASFQSPGFVETIPNYFITGYSNDSNDGISGITIHGCKMLKSGESLDLKVFISLNDVEYKFINELQSDAAACDEEVLQYLFEEKWGMRQDSLDFECDEPAEATIVEMKPKRGRKKKIEEAHVLEEAV